MKTLQLTNTPSVGDSESTYSILKKAGCATGLLGKTHIKIHTP